MQYLFYPCIFTSTKYWMVISREAAHITVISELYDSMNWKNCRNFWNLQIWSKYSEFDRENSTLEYCPHYNFAPQWNWDDKQKQNDFFVFVTGSGSLVPIGNQKQGRKWQPVFESLQNSKNGCLFLTSKNQFKDAIFIFIFDRLVPLGRSKINVNKTKGLGLGLVVSWCNCTSSRTGAVSSFMIISA